MSVLTYPPQPDYLPKGMRIYPLQWLLIYECGLRSFVWHHPPCSYMKIKGMELNNDKTAGHRTLEWCRNQASTVCIMESAKLVGKTCGRKIGSVFLVLCCDSCTLPSLQRVNKSLCYFVLVFCSRFYNTVTTPRHTYLL